MNNSKGKKLLKLAVGIYLLSFLVINWSDVSWVFNYKSLYGAVNDFFNPYPSINTVSINQYFYPNRSEEKANLLTEIKTIYTEKQNLLEIPKINVSAPIVFSSTTDKDLLLDDLSQGVVYYPGSVYPGQTGQIVVLGHSAPPNWPNKIESLFSNLEELNNGDVIYINLNNKQYKYVIREKTVIEKGSDVPQGINPNTNSLVLISCWPPGKDYQRIVVQAEIQDNI